MSDVVIKPGDCIHLALPWSPDPNRLGDAVTRAYEQLGVRVFMVDHVQGLTASTVVGVVRGVDPAVRFERKSQ